jgi:acid phosphatase (class A)
LTIFSSRKLALAFTFAAVAISPVGSQTMSSNQPAANALAPAKPKKVFLYLTAEDFSPARTLPPPPAAGSDEEARELVTLRALIKSATPERMEQAKWDDVHEDPAIFDATLGISLKTMPKTWGLLSAIANDAGIATNLAKAHFNRTRPWGADPTLPNCDAGRGKKPVGSYPSGHSTLGYSVGFALAQLIPGKAPQILARANDYALSREYCGVHFPSDTAASHVYASLTSRKLMSEPKLAKLIAAARAELKAAGQPTS